MGPSLSMSVSTLVLAVLTLSSMAASAPAAGPFSWAARHLPQVKEANVMEALNTVMPDMDEDSDPKVRMVRDVQAFENLKFAEDLKDYEMDLIIKSIKNSILRNVLAQQGGSGILGSMN